MSVKPTPEGQRALAEHARRIAEMLAPKNLSTAMLFQRIARAHDVEAARLERPVVHVSAGPLEPVGYVRCLPSGAVHPAGECRADEAAKGKP